MHTNELEAVTRWLSEQQEAMLQLLADLVNIDSGSYDKDGVDAVGARVTQFLSTHDIDVSLIHHRDVGDTLRAEIGDVRRNGHRDNILLLGHRDTVFPKGEATRRPFYVESGRAYGPGVASMKAGLVMSAFVMAAFKRLAPQVPLVMLMTGDAQIGSTISREYIFQEAKSAVAVFNAEPGQATGNIVTGRKGSLNYRLDIFGKEAHSGVSFTEGASAIAELGHKIVALSDLTRTDDGITVNVGTVSGGRCVNMTADSASAEFEVRFITSQQRDAVRRAIEAISAKSRIPGTTTKLVYESDGLAFMPTAAGEKLAALYFQSARGFGAIIEGDFSGGCADSGFAANADAPTLCAVGPVGGNAYTSAEYIELNTLHQRAQILAETIRLLCLGT